MQKKKIGLWILGMLLICGLGVFFFNVLGKKGFFGKEKDSGGVSQENSKKQYLAVIPHFMIRSQRVSDFYAFLQKKYFAQKTPDQIVLISPNHFFPQMPNPVSLCQDRNVKYRGTSLFAQARMDKRIVCEEAVFVQRGAQWYTRDHGLGVHFPFIQVFFPAVEKIYLLAMPSHRMSNAVQIAEQIRNLSGKSLIIGSVDFSHYQPEAIAEANDQVSFATLSESGAISRLKALDVDCPACLGVLDLLAQKQGMGVQQWLRDSSSTILGKDMREENTSRQFLWRKS